MTRLSDVVSVSGILSIEKVFVKRVIPLFLFQENVFSIDRHFTHRVPKEKGFVKRKRL